MKRTCFFIAFFLFLLFGQSFGQGNNHDFSPNAKLPVDPNMRTGTLKNGMHYYIRKNAKPEHRAELRLAVHAGSVLESDYQQGLAHLTEHMAFNGTKNFSKSGIVDYLESIGIRFGADLNAYTSYDETVYMLQVPTDTPKFMTQGLQILEDWAHNVSFEDIEIDKERGVVIEEWRLGRGAFDRMGRKIDPVIYNNSIYSDRSPIGKKDIIANCKYDTLKKFYKDWYRPDLQAIVVVGDFDIDQMEKMVIAQFSNIPEPQNPRHRTMYTIPPHKGTVAAVATDKEDQYVLLRVQCRHEKMNYATVNDYRDHIKQRLFSQMITSRLEELQHRASPPFTYSYANIGSDLGNTSEYELFAVAADNDIAGSLKALINENEQIKRYGFNASELERAKKIVLQVIESAYKEKDKTDSKGLTDECVRNFLNNEDIMGIANEYAFNEKFIPEITLDEINALSREWITDDNNNIIVEAPEKEGIKIPTRDEILAMVAASKTDQLEAYKDITSDKKLLGNKPKGGKVVKENINKETGTTEWTLSNGAKVVLKPTDFKEDEILFGAYSPGGTSCVADKDFVTCSNAASIVNDCGVADFNATALDKMLAGKKVSVYPYMNDLYERFGGSASPADIEAMLQLTYLYFTQPNVEKDGFESYVTRIKSFVQNNSLSPEGVMRDSNQVTVYNHHFRQRPYNVQLLNEIDESKVLELYKARFANAGNFTFFFVGNFKPEDLKPMIETYIGGLPSKGKKESWKDPGYTFPKGIVKKIVTKGTEPKSYVAITMKGRFEWNLKNKVEAEAMMKVLNVMLRETMREDKSGVYGVGASLTPVRYPGPGYTITIQFGCAPENVDMLVQTAFEQIEKLKKEGPSSVNMEKAKETMHRTREVNLKDNNFWVSVLQTYYMNGDQVSDIMKYDDAVNAITARDVQNACARYFNMDNYVETVLLPEK
jgi:zinc protease